MIEQTGSVLTFITNKDNAGTVSSTITVPDDAEKVIVGVSQYQGTTDGLAAMTFTKDGVDTAMTKQGGDASIASWQGAIFWMDLPDTGSNKTLKWDWIGTGLSGEHGLVSVTFWKGCDTGIRDGDYDQDTSVPILTPTLTAQTGDKIVAFAFGFASAEGTVDTWTNLTLLAQIAKNDAADGAWATADPTGNQTVGFSAETNWDDCGIVAIVLTPEGTEGFPIPDHLTGSLAVTSGTTLDFSALGTVEAGDLLVFVPLIPGANNVGLNQPSGWTTIASAVSNPSAQVFSKIAAGGESSMSLSTANGTSRTVYYWIAKFDGTAHASTVPEASGGNGADPPSLNPSGWDVENTLWFAICCTIGGITASSSGYTLHRFGGTGSQFAVLGKESAAASDDPGTFTVTNDAVILTLAIRPAAAAVADAVSGYQRLYGPARLGTSADDLFEVPTGAQVQLRSVYVNNPTAGTVKVTLSIGADAAGTRFVELLDIPAGESRQGRRATNHTLVAGEKIQGSCDTASAAVLVIDGHMAVV